jgi:TfoX/Sxy family transcriptional regulator of competence genes
VPLESIEEWSGTAMPYNTALEEKIEDIVKQWDSLEKKKMFGGICYLINSNMSFGVWRDYLIVRMAPELAAEKLNTEHVKEFDITGKPMKGWVMVEKGSWNKKDELTRWLDIGRSFVLSLPKKSPKRKSLEEIYYRNKR